MSNYENYTSTKWKEHFDNNKKYIASFLERKDLRLSSEELAIISSSIQQFQLGESSEGANLKRLAKQQSLLLNDPEYYFAMEAFIGEENDHSLILKHLMLGNQIPELTNCWLDQAFRTIRKLAGLELQIITLLAAEIIAVPYYQALARATVNPYLKDICKKILNDEATHLSFQTYNLFLLRNNKTNFYRCVMIRFQKLLLLVSCLVVWTEHRKVLQAGELNLGNFIRLAFKELKNINHNLRQLLSQDSRFSQSINFIKAN